LASHFLRVKILQPYVRGGTAIHREREPFAREAVHKLEREKRREIIREKDRPTRRKQPQVEKDVEALPRHPRRRRKTQSEVSP
jgi:hypothetical protein